MFRRFPWLQRFVFCLEGLELPLQGGNDDRLDSRFGGFIYRQDVVRVGIRVPGRYCELSLRMSQLDLFLLDRIFHSTATLKLFVRHVCFPPFVHVVLKFVQAFRIPSDFPLAFNLAPVGRFSAMDTLGRWPWLPGHGRTSQ